MYAKTIKNPLLGRVERIISEKGQAKNLSNHIFREIRNKPLLRKALDELGYRPDNQAKPMVWTRKNPYQ